MGKNGDYGCEKKRENAPFYSNIRSEIASRSRPSTSTNPKQKKTTKEKAQISVRKGDCGELDAESIGSPAAERKELRVI